MLDRISLRFSDPRLEHAFRRVHSKEAARSVALVSFIAAMALSGFGFMDLAIGTWPISVLVVRYGFMVPLLLAATVLAWQPGLRRFADSFGAFVFGAVAVVQASFLLGADLGQGFVIQIGFVLILIGGYTCTRIRWRSAAIAGVGASLVDMGMLWGIGLEPWYAASLQLHVVTANVLGLLVVWNQEKSARDRFLDIREIRMQRNETTRLNLRLREQALTDPLTGLSNRRAMEIRLEEAVATARRHETAGCLVLLDLDGFKEVNDRLGHAAGDQLLQHLSELLRSELRATDRAYRMGGDEFCLYLSGRTAREAQRIVERLRDRLETETRVLEMPVSFSAGCSAIRPGDLSPDDPLGRADALLYLAKANGKGRVVADGGRRGDGETMPAS